jgi:hypothetical protein
VENPSFKTLSNENLEINIKEIITKLISNKLTFIKFCGVALVAWLLCATIYYFIATPTNHYSIVIAYNFPQAAEGKYPNGNPLNASDILSGSSLEASWKESNLEDKGIPLNDFVAGVSVEPYSQTFNSAEKNINRF